MEPRQALNCPIQNLVDDEESDDDLDETLSERLWGLTEMFPEGFRKWTSSLVNRSYKVFTRIFQFSRSATSVFVTTSIILFLPIIVEYERARVMERQRNQERQVLLGPNSSYSDRLSRS